MRSLRSDLGGDVGSGCRCGCHKDWQAGTKEMGEVDAPEVCSRVEWEKGKGGATAAGLVDKDVATKCVS